MEYHHDFNGDYEHLNPAETQSKYALALSKYNTHIHDDEIMSRVDALIGKHLDENDNLEAKKQLLHCIVRTPKKVS